MRSRVEAPATAAFLRRFNHNRRVTENYPEVPLQLSRWWEIGTSTQVLVVAAGPVR